MRSLSLILILTCATNLVAEDSALQERIVAAADLSGHLAKVAKELIEQAGGERRVRIREGHVHDMSKNELKPYLAEIATVDAQDRPDGIERFYRPWSWTPTGEKRWKNGVQHGLERVFEHPDGGQKPFCRHEIPWVDGRIEGERKTLDAAGNTVVSTPYVGGEPEGIAKSWDSQGRLIRESTMKAGRRHGALIEYWPETGKPKRQAMYEEGRVVGVVRDFYQDGSLKRETPFLNNARHGIEKSYATDGSVTKTSFYLNGDAVSEADYLKAGTTPTGTAP